MKISLFGKGKMGCRVERTALERSHQIVPFEQSETVIDFSHPDAIIKNLIKSSQENKNVVMGTTGWYDRMDEVQEIVENAGIGFIWAANFSIGVWLFNQMVKHAAQLIGASGRYDASIVETHHREKVDRPSGTAKVLGANLLENFEGKTELAEDPVGSIPKEAVAVHSIRSGCNPGKHEVRFDAPTDTITLTHQAHSRESFALGAVVAAEWLQGKRGFFNLDAMMEEQND
jgi:4-hydroxy-tetrahydrodipicolinate reductase